MISFSLDFHGRYETRLGRKELSSKMAYELPRRYYLIAPNRNYFRQPSAK